MCGAARQALSASNRHRLHTCCVLAPGTTPVVPHGTRVPGCLCPPHANVRSACLPLAEEPCSTECPLPADPIPGLGDARGSGFPSSQPAALPSAPAPPSTPPQPRLPLLPSLTSSCATSKSQIATVCLRGNQMHPRGRSARLGDQDPREGLGDIYCEAELRSRGTKRDRHRIKPKGHLCPPHLAPS